MKKFKFNPVTGRLDLVSEESLRLISTELEQVIKYGPLYNWWAATDARKISSSDDWVLPRYTLYTAGGDFEILVNFLGGDSVAAGKLKEVGTTHWDNPNVGATNESGFNARGAGYRSIFSGSIKTVGPLWTNCEINATQAVILSLYASGANTFAPKATGYDANGKYYGQGVRLVRTSTTRSHGETGTYVGNDGRTYQTICIGTQEWLSENLAETKFRNGDPIPLVTGDSAWAALTTPGRCSYNDDDTNTFDDEPKTDHEIPANTPIYIDGTISGSGTEEDPICVTQSARTVTMSDSEIVLNAAEDFERTCGADEQFTVTNPVIKKPFRMKLTGGTLNATLFSGYTEHWVSGSEKTDYVPGSDNWLYCEIRAAGEIYLFFES